MEGSEKQIEWAEKIRMETVEHFEKNEIPKYEKRGERGQIMAECFRKSLKNYTDYERENRDQAEWWINNRDKHIPMVYNWAQKRFEKAEVSA